jgi:CheY-like chemotaxis protein
MKVLVVEDDDLVRIVAVECLQEAGFDVVEAATGEEALAKCKERVADALFTDIRLPGQVSGWDIAEFCREHNPRLPVVYATGFSPEAARVVPGARLFHKPYQMETVINTIRELTGSARLN